MAENNNNQTIFQRLTNVFRNDNGVSTNYTLPTKKVNTYGLRGNEPIFTTTDKNEYERKKLELRQQHLLAMQWKKANYDISSTSLAGYSETKMMYRDADLMDAFPEIGAALDVVSEEACYIGKTGNMVNVYSKSERIKSILEDLLVNRLSITTTLPMITRSTCKYGNTFMLLNLSGTNGVLGWRQLPVYEMERYESSKDNPYSDQIASYDKKLAANMDGTQFIWVGEGSFIPYQNWQIGHFRLLYDSLFLPYGMSFLNKARRHFRMLSLMEDMMLLYRLERSIERRVFKIDVGAIDEADVPSYVQTIADNFKRTPFVDPMTGQLDLRKNILSNSDDYFVPMRDPSSPSPIETLPAAQNMTALDDIKYVQNKIFTALRVPKPFLNFEENAGDGKNLSLLDVRFTRTVNRIQQMMLMELNKICVIHLYLLGFEDELTNFSLTMNNPSSQAEMLELENMSKKISLMRDAVSDPGLGIPIMSMQMAWREILGLTDREISNILDQLRLEAALAVELKKTPEIIKKTNIFKAVDNIYGEPGAEYSDTVGEEGGDEGMPGGGGGFGGGFGGDMDMGGGVPEGDMVGEEGNMDMGAGVGEEAALAGGPEPGGEAPAGPEPPVGEDLMTRKLKDLITENRTLRKQKPGKQPIRIVNEDTLQRQSAQTVSLYDKTFIINEELNSIAGNLKRVMENKEVEVFNVEKLLKKQY